METVLQQKEKARTESRFAPDSEGFYGNFGGAFIPEMLRPNVEELRNNYLKITAEAGFRADFDKLLRDYVGRPSPLYFAKRLSEKYRTNIWLKREDLNHTGAHKINNTVGQILLAERLGKKTNYCRNRRRPARSGHGHGLRPQEYSMHYLYGRNGHCPASPERRPDADARSRSPAGRFGQQNAQRRNQRSPARLDK